MKSRLLLPVFLVGLLALTAIPSAAQDKKDKAFDKVPKTGPEHKQLAELAGKYDAKVKSWFGPGEPKTSAGKMTREVIMDGRYLQERFKGDFLGTPFKGLGLLGYDMTRKKYVMAWVDNFGTGIELNSGTYDAASKTYTFLGETDHPDFGGKMKTRDVLTIVSDTEQTFEMFRIPMKTGKEMKVMEVTYTRKK